MNTNEGKLYNSETMLFIEEMKEVLFTRTYQQYTTFTKTMFYGSSTKIIKKKLLQKKATAKVSFLVNEQNFTRAVHDSIIGQVLDTVLKQKGLHQTQFNEIDL